MNTKYQFLFFLFEREDFVKKLEIEIKQSEPPKSNLKCEQATHRIKLDTTWDGFPVFSAL